MIISQISFGDALRAMTGPKWESAFILFVIIQQLLKLYGAIHRFVLPSAFVSRRIDLSNLQQLSDCAADVVVISLFYNSLTPSEY